MFEKLARFRALSSSRGVSAPRLLAQSNDTRPCTRSFRIRPHQAADPGVPLATCRRWWSTRMPLDVELLEASRTESRSDVGR